MILTEKHLSFCGGFVQFNRKTFSKRKNEIFAVLILHFLRIAHIIGPLKNGFSFIIELSEFSIHSTHKPLSDTCFVSVASVFTPHFESLPSCSVSLLFFFFSL